jgi:flavin-dependent dehydrogenase
MLQPITAFRTGLIDGHDMESRYPTTVSYGIRRCEFDDYLLKRSGARLRLGESLKSLQRIAGQWLVNDSITAPLVIGAGGHFCPVAAYMGAKLGANEPIIAAKEIEFAMSPEQDANCQVQGDTPELYFCQDLRGYGWCFRKGNYLNIGLGRESSVQLGVHVKGFYHFLKQRGRIPQDIPDNLKGHAYLLYGHAQRPHIAEGMLLVGDAAGLAYPQSGEGIRPAVESGLMAAGVIIKAATDYSIDKLQPYSRALELRFGPAVESSTVGTRGATTLIRNCLAHRLLNNRLFTRHVLLDRWFLHSHQAALHVS